MLSVLHLVALSLLFTSVTSSIAKWQCAYSEWHSWGDCTSPCGGGIRTRHKSLDTGASLKHHNFERSNDTNPLVNCVSAVTDMSQCNTHVCTGGVLFGGNSKTPSDCTVSDWSPWSECSCAFRKQHRRRRVQTMPLSTGRPCPPLNETRTCDATTDDSRCRGRVGGGAASEWQTTRAPRFGQPQPYADVPNGRDAGRAVRADDITWAERELIRERTKMTRSMGNLLRLMIAEMRDEE